MAIGTTIKRLRKRKGISQERLAALVGCSGPAVNMWERAKNPSKPSLGRLRKIAEALECDYETLLNAYLGRRAA